MARCGARHGALTPAVSGRTILAPSVDKEMAYDYEYLAYMTVLLSMLIQLDAHGGLPTDAFAPGATSSGGTFEFAPARDMFKPAMLAPRLSPPQEALIFNRFGPSYLGVCAQLLSLDWLYAPRVRDNLGKLFGVALSH